MPNRFQSFEELLTFWAAESPDSPALRYEDGILTFSELLERVQKRAAELKSTGKSCLGMLSDGSLDCGSPLVNMVRYLDVEESWILLMNQNFKLIRHACISRGGISETAVDVRIILKEALLCNATVVALCHNHPSNNPKPSHDDNKLTERVKKACDIMRIYLLDHVIITDGAYYSYHEQGLL